MMTVGGSLSKVTVGIVNCNRLFYLRSCVESFLVCAQDYSNLELIIVDNASIEDGTAQYLDELERRGFSVIRQRDRDPDNEFAKALNLIHRHARGEVVIMLQGDMQFVIRHRWLHGIVELIGERDDVGCVMLDAQRRVRLAREQFAEKVVTRSGEQFIASLSRNPVNCAGDVAFAKRVLDIIAPWCENNLSHEGGADSETKMLDRVKEIVARGMLNWRCFLPIIPPAVMIYTDQRGTNARVRGDKRYGNYWAPIEGSSYYAIRDHGDELFTRFRENSACPMPIEDLAVPSGWEAPIDSSGDWKKCPIDPATASTEDYVSLTAPPSVDKISADQEFDAWLTR